MTTDPSSTPAAYTDPVQLRCNPGAGGCGRTFTADAQSQCATSGPLCPDCLDERGTPPPPG